MKNGTRKGHQKLNIFHDKFARYDIRSNTLCLQPRSKLFRASSSIVSRRTAKIRKNGKDTDVKKIRFIGVNIGDVYCKNICGDKRNDDTKGDTSCDGSEWL